MLRNKCPGASDVHMGTVYSVVIAFVEPTLALAALTPEDGDGQEQRQWRAAGKSGREQQRRQGHRAVADGRIRLAEHDGKAVGRRSG